MKRCVSLMNGYTPTRNTACRIYCITRKFSCIQYPQHQIEIYLYYYYVGLGTTYIILLLFWSFYTETTADLGFRWKGGSIMSPLMSVWSFKHEVTISNTDNEITHSKEKKQFDFHKKAIDLYQSASSEINSQRCIHFVDSNIHINQQIYMFNDGLNIGVYLWNNSPITWSPTNYRHDQVQCPNINNHIPVYTSVVYMSPCCMLYTYIEL